MKSSNVSAEIDRRKQIKYQAGGICIYKDRERENQQQHETFPHTWIIRYGMDGKILSSYPCQLSVSFSY